MIMKQYRFLLCLILCCLASFAAVPAQAATQIRGVVVNGASDAGAGGVSVELRRNGDPDKPGKLIATTTTNAAGQFSFLVPMAEHDSLLVVRALYKGFPYEVPAYDGGKRLNQFNVDIDPGKVRLPVYDTTTSLVPLELSVSHMNVKPRAGGISCTEFLIVNNPTKKTFLGIGQDKATILLDLPKGAKNVRLNSQTTGAKLNKRPDGYSISKAIPPSLDAPGTAIVVDYDMDWPSRLPWQRSLDLSREVQYPTRFFFVQRDATDRVLQVSGFLKTDKEETPLSGDQSIQMDIDGQPQDRVINAIGNPKAQESILAPGNELHIEVSSPINPAFWAFLAFLVLLIILIPFALWRRTAPPSPAAAKADKIGEPVQPQSVYDGTQQHESAGADWLQTPDAAQLIAQIAALDEDHEAGRISDEEYRQQRAAYKRALMQSALGANNQ